MPDMQTALKEALNEWDDSAGRHHVQPETKTEEKQMQNNYTPTPVHHHGDALRSVFEFVKAHPNSSVNEIVAAGVQQNTISSTINRLYNSGRLLRTSHLEERNSGNGPVKRNVFRYTTAVENVYDRAPFVPNPQPPKKKIILRKKQAAQPAQGIAALPMVEVKTKEQEQREYIASRKLHPELLEAIKPKAVLTAAYVIDNISLSEAVLLHAELKKMLG